MLDEDGEEEDVSILPRLALLQKYNPSKAELKKMKEDYYRLMVSRSL